MLRMIGWTALALVAGVVLFLAATIRVIEPQPETSDPPAPAQIESGPSQFVVPVQGVGPAALRRDWGDARDGGARTHQGLDIMAPAGAPVVAAADGVVEKLYFSKGGGGITLYQRARGGLMLYYAHLRAYAEGIAEGRRVRAGETIGYVGDSGNAGTGNYHLHFAVARMAAGERWWQGTPIDPYPLLARARSGR